MDKKVERVVLSGSSQLPLVLDRGLPDVQLAVEMAPSYCAFFCCCSSFFSALSQSSKFCILSCSQSIISHSLNSHFHTPYQIITAPWIKSKIRKARINLKHNRHLAGTRAISSKSETLQEKVSASLRQPTYRVEPVS